MAAIGHNRPSVLCHGTDGQVRRCIVGLGILRLHCQCGAGYVRPATSYAHKPQDFCMSVFWVGVVTAIATCGFVAAIV